MSHRDHSEPVGALGRKVEYPEPPKEPAEVAPGVFRGADGKLFTDIAPAPPTYPYVTIFADGSAEFRLPGPLVIGVLPDHNC